MTVLWLAPKPARCRCSITRTPGKRSRTASGEPSSDALSSATISTLASCAGSVSRQASSSSREFVLTSETETSGTELNARGRGRRAPRGRARISARRPGADDRLGCGSPAAPRLLPLEPHEQVPHPVLEGDLRAEPE